MAAAQKVYGEYIPARTNTYAVGQKSVNHRQNYIISVKMHTACVAL